MFNSYIDILSEFVLTKKFISVSCTTTTTMTAGDYKTIRNPGAQVAQCLAITVPVGSKIQITCTVVYTQAGTYTMVSRDTTSYMEQFL
jgi:hypothetical protein